MRTMNSLTTTIIIKYAGVKPSMKAASLPYPGMEDLKSGHLPEGGYRIAYHDISPALIHFVNNISISKGHRMISGFFGTGLLIVGFVDRILHLAPQEEPTFTAGFGLLTSLILLFICFSRNATIKQLNSILESHVAEGGYGVFTKNEDVKKEISGFEIGKYAVTVPSPFLMLKGIELIPRS